MIGIERERGAAAASPLASLLGRLLLPGRDALLALDARLEALARHRVHAEGGEQLPQDVVGRQVAVLELLPLAGRSPPARTGGPRRGSSAALQTIRTSAEPTRAAASASAPPRVLGLRLHHVAVEVVLGTAALLERLVAGCARSTVHGSCSASSAAATRRRSPRPRGQRAGRPRHGTGSATARRPPAGCARTNASPTRISAGSMSGLTGSLTSRTQRPFTKNANRASVDRRKSIIRASTSVTAKRRSGERSAKRRLNSSDSSSMSPRPDEVERLLEDALARDRHLRPGPVDLGHHAREVLVAAADVARVRLDLVVVAEVEAPEGEAVVPLPPHHVLGGSPVALAEQRERHPGAPEGVDVAVLEPVPGGDGRERPPGDDGPAARGWRPPPMAMQMATTTRNPPRRHDRLTSDPSEGECGDGVPRWHPGTPFRYPQDASRSERVPFKVGDKVVYPHHGAAVIEGTDNITMPDGAKSKYFVLRMTHGDLTLKVPTDRAEEIGMRYPISKEDVEDVFEVLAKKDVREPTNWSRRFKNHQEKLKSGDVYQVAEVVRNLALPRRRQGAVGRREVDVRQGPPGAGERAGLRAQHLRGHGARAPQQDAVVVHRRCRCVAGLLAARGRDDRVQRRQRRRPTTPRRPPRARADDRHHGADHHDRRARGASRSWSPSRGCRPSPTSSTRRPTSAATAWCSPTRTPTSWPPACGSSPASSIPRAPSCSSTAPCSTASSPASGWRWAAR